MQIYNPITGSDARNLPAPEPAAKIQKRKKGKKNARKSKKKQGSKR